MSKKTEMILSGILKMLMIDIAITIDHSRYTSSDKQKTHLQIENAFDEVIAEIKACSSENVSRDTPNANRFRRQYRMRINR